MAERDTHKYQLKEGRRVVYRGITYDLARRAAEHRVDFPKATLKQVGRCITRDAALKWERNGGRRPYNQ